MREAIAADDGGGAIETELSSGNDGEQQNSLGHPLALPTSYGLDYIGSGPVGSRKSLAVRCILLFISTTKPAWHV
jgi:hypothetical protein